jgi:hypothetical protein
LDNEFTLGATLKPVTFLWQFLVILKKQFVTNALFKKKSEKMNYLILNIPKFVTICLQYKRILKTFYFHILKIKKIGEIYLWMIAT